MRRAAPLALLCSVLCIVCAIPVHAQVFHDDFDGTSLDPAKWNISGGGTITVGGGISTQSADCVEIPPPTVIVPPPEMFHLAGSRLVPSKSSWKTWA